MSTEHGARTPHDGCAWPRRPTVSGLPPRPSTERTLPAHRRAARRRADHPTRERALEVTPDRPPHPLLATAATAVSRRRRRDVSARTRRPARRWASTRRRELSAVGTVWPWRDVTPPPPEHRPSRVGGCGGCLHARLLVWAQDSTSRLAWRCRAPRAHGQKSRRPPFDAREHGGGLDRSAGRQRTQAHDRPRRTPTTSCRLTSVVSVAPALLSTQGGDHRVDGERAWSCGELSGRSSDGLLRAGLDAASLSRHGRGDRK